MVGSPFEDDARRRGGSEEPIGAREALTADVYEALRGIAASYLRGQAKESITPSVLVHEAWVKVAQTSAARWNGQEHFKATAARAIRQILVDRARSARARHGRVTVSSSLFEAPEDELDVEALDRALRRLCESDPRSATVVELRFFGGMTQEEIAGELGIVVRTVQEDWAFAQSWLRREMSAYR